MIQYALIRAFAYILINCSSRFLNLLKKSRHFLHQKAINDVIITRNDIITLSATSFRNDDYRKQQPIMADTDS